MPDFTKKNLADLYKEKLAGLVKCPKITRHLGPQMNYIFRAGRFGALII